MNIYEVLKRLVYSHNSKENQNEIKTLGKVAVEGGTLWDCASFSCKNSASQESGT
jgi:hypothetical protein